MKVNKIRLNGFNAMLLIFICVAAIFLFFNNYHAKKLEQKIHLINDEIEAEQHDIAILEREVEYLAHPSRILNLTTQILPFMQNPNGAQILAKTQLKAHLQQHFYAEEKSLR